METTSPNLGARTGGLLGLLPSVAKRLPQADGHSRVELSYVDPAVRRERSRSFTAMSIVLLVWSGLVLLVVDRGFLLLLISTIKLLKVSIRFSMEARTLHVDKLFDRIVSPRIVLYVYSAARPAAVV